MKPSHRHSKIAFSRARSCEPGQRTVDASSRPHTRRIAQAYGRGEGPMSDVIELPSGRGRTAELIFSLSSFRNDFN
jgi:hypothetical protein